MFVGLSFAVFLRKFTSKTLINYFIMKKIVQMFAIAGCILFAATNTLKATTHDVEVEDFEFNPSTFIANVGDTVHWYWEEGFHTTTSFIIPPGAPTWDQPLSSGSQTFDYVITVPGSYDYICSPHASMGMTGHFTVLGATSLQENTSPSLAIIKNYVRGGQLHFDYFTPTNTQVTIELFDIVGHQVHGENALSQVGNHSHQIEVAYLPKGIYILSLFAQDARITKRIIIE